MFVLGPRLILSVRQYHAELVANSDAGTDISTIAFQERVPVSTGTDMWLDKRSRDSFGILMEQENTPHC
jgi:hypothetical protein